MKRISALVFFVVAGGFLIAGFWWSAEANDQPGNAARRLSFEERVAYQRKVEEVYWRHNIWNNPTAKPKLDEVLPSAALRARVEENLRAGAALETRFHRPITAGKLQAEVERMARQTKQPGVLRELFDALDNDPFLVAEILARPALSKTLLNEIGAADETLQSEFQNQFGSTNESPDGEARFAAWWQAHRQEFGVEVTQFAQPFAMPEIVPTGTDDTWSTMSAPPFGGTDATAVWTGTEMIVWKGGTAQGTRYNPATDLMLPVLRTGAPLPRVRHTAVWTGTEMVIWGGYSSVAPLDEFKVGGRFNPQTETWTPTSAVNAPSVRTEHTAVWTGSEMIIWSGQDATTGAYLVSGGRYNPANDTWTTTSQTNTPSGRTRHTVVWTGSEMIVWGGVSGNGGVNTGGRYNPSSDSWVATNTAGAPSPRFNHTAVWTGTEMIIWGGNFDFTILNTGGRYNPASDSWTPTSIPPLQARRLHTAVWTGTEMIIWGGCVDIQCSQSRDDGSRYNPASDSWTPTAPTTAGNRSRHAAVWTGTDMLIAGGCRGGECQIQVSTIGRYNPSTNVWLPVTHPPIATPRQPHKAVWTGSEMLVWGVDAQLLDTSVYRFNPATNRWARTFLAGAPDARFNFSLIWTGTEMIVWGGDVQGLGQTRTGARFNPMTDTWTETEINGSPSARDLHEAVWTGSEMIIWGGVPGSGTTNTGGRYNPSTNTWTATTTAGAPTGRILHTVVWTGQEMIVWGGSDLNLTTTFNTGGRYNPATNTWTATAIANAPTGRHSHTAVWTGEEMIIWGGKAADANFFNTGGRYNPQSDSWTPTSLANAPSPRWIHSAIWTGSEMIVWGGVINDAFPFVSTNTGGRYHPATNNWRPTSLLAAPDRRDAHTAVWTGSEMIIWGGSRDPESGYVNTGSVYHVESGPFPTPTPTATPTASATATPIGTVTPTPTAPGPTPTATPISTSTPTPPGPTPTPTPVSTLTPTPTAPAFTPTPTPIGTLTPTPTAPGPTPTPSPGPASKAMNLSTRVRIQTGDNVGIGGFIITGPVPKRVLIRAVGPSLSGFGVPNPVADPILELHGPDEFVAMTNDNWRDDPIQESAVLATGIPPTDNLESAIVARLTPGAYTAVVRGKNTTAGVGLAEVYDLEPETPAKLANLSTRAVVGTGDDIVIAGFILGPSDTAEQVVIRGIGPSLEAAGLADALSNPTLELRDSNGALLMINNDWQENPAQATEISAAGLAPTNNLESAIAATLPPGAYTALLAGRDGDTGIGVVEIYDRGPTP